MFEIYIRSSLARFYSEFNYAPSSLLSFNFNLDILLHLQQRFYLSVCGSWKKALLLYCEEGRGAKYEIVLLHSDSKLTQPASVRDPGLLTSSSSSRAFRYAVQHERRSEVSAKLPGIRDSHT